MAVQAASLKVLEKAAVPPVQARAIVRAIEIEIAGGAAGDLGSEMHAIAASPLKQTYGAMLGQLAVLLGVAYFLITHVPR